jgi:acetoin utilization deacetylase AcuC-like enzyme
LERRDWLGWERREAPEVDLVQLERIHPPEHIEHIRATAASGGGWFDADTVASPGSWQAALHAAGGACALVDAVMTREAPTGFAGLRPPGHHCERARPMGFCLFNNVAVAAQHALDAHGAERVAVFDWDVHHGNGTNDIFHARRDVLYISIHQSPLYPGSGPLRDVGEGEGEGYTVNLPVPPGAGETIWLSLVQHIVMPTLRSFEPDLILVSAGFDAHRADPLAQCMLATESFAKMATEVRATAQDLGVPFGALLEGGYDLDALAASVAATLEAFADDSAQPETVAPEEVTERAAAVVGKFWPVSA